MPARMANAHAKRPTALAVGCRVPETGPAAQPESRRRLAPPSFGKTPRVPVDDSRRDRPAGAAGGRASTAAAAPELAPTRSAGAVRLAQKALQPGQRGIPDGGRQLAAPCLGVRRRHAQGLQELRQAHRLTVALALAFSLGVAPFGQPPRAGIGAPVGTLRPLGALAFDKALRPNGAGRSSRRRPVGQLQPDAHPHGEETVPKLRRRGQKLRRILPRRLRDPRRRQTQLISTPRHRRDHLERRISRGCGGGGHWNKYRTSGGHVNASIRGADSLRGPLSTPEVGSAHAVVVRGRKTAMRHGPTRTSSRQPDTHIASPGRPRSDH